MNAAISSGMSNVSTAVPLINQQLRNTLMSGGGGGGASNLRNNSHNFATSNQVEGLSRMYRSRDSNNVFFPSRPTAGDTCLT